MSNRGKEMLEQAYREIADNPDLPSPTGVALRIIELADQDDVELADLAAVVETDPAIAARLLRLVNSPAMGMRRTVGSISQAISLLGLRTVKWITLGVSLVSNHSRGRCEHFNYEGFWSESLGRAVAARALTRRVGKFDPNELFAYALLSQLGRLVLAQVCQERYSNLLATVAEDDPAELALLENAIFGFGHHELTARLIVDWSLPDLAGEAIRQQYDVQPGLGERVSQGEQAAGILQIAGLTARLLSKVEPPPPLPMLLMKKARLLGIGPDGYHELFDAVRQEWLEAGKVFDLQCRVVPSLSEIYLAARRRMAALGEELQMQEPETATDPWGDGEQTFTAD
jgi:HD-like signal output (HDOD) protein